MCFLLSSSRYLSTFNYIYLRAQHEAEKRGKNMIEKEYVWPLSFPDCTPKLRMYSNLKIYSHRLLLLTHTHAHNILGEAIAQWIRHHFSRSKRAKCLILIGSTGTGKTSFALSLPGRVNYF
jgi:flagellar biosynthesis GTPase FlhF